MNAKTNHILMIDGSSVTLQMLSKIVSDEIPGIVIDTCKNAQEADKKIQENTYHLISTALMLPDMDGLELCRRIRKSNKNKYTNIIVVSSDADERLQQEGYKAGVTNYFDKSDGCKAFASFIQPYVQQSPDLKGHILFIEDSKTAAVIVRKSLEKYGLTVTHTDSAEQAIDLIKEQHANKNNTNTYDLVITDFHLKGKLTGGDLLYAIRTHFHFSEQELPVLVVTGNDDTKTQVEVFHAGGNDFVPKPIVEEVLIARVRLLVMIHQQFETLKQQAEDMRRIASTDSLTGVRSKRYLLDNGEEFIQAKENQTVWAMLIDIDYFKKINDDLGHIKGDHVLAALGQQLNQSYPKDMVSRFGGEEFSILIKNESQDEALQKAEILRKEVAELIPAGVPLTISIGLASMQDYPDADLTQILALADKALYAAKENGRNRVYFNQPDGTKPTPFH